jgi:hypothetical protein
LTKVVSANGRMWRRPATRTTAPGARRLREDAPGAGRSGDSGLLDANQVRPTCSVNSGVCILSQFGMTESPARTPNRKFGSSLPNSRLPGESRSRPVRPTTAARLLPVVLWRCESRQR